MHIEVEITTDSERFNRLIDPSWVNYFDTYTHTELDKFLCISEGEREISLPFTIHGSEVYASARSFVGGYATNISDLSEQSRLLTHGLEFLGRSGYDKLVHKELPNYYDHIVGFSKWPIFWGEGESYSTYETSIVKVEDLILNTLRSRLLQKARKSLAVGLITEPSDIILHWNFLQESLKDRGLSFLSSERIEYLINRFPDRFMLYGTKSSSGAPQGTIFVDVIYNVARLVNYYSSREPEFSGSVELFVDYFTRSAVASKFNYLDFGTSTSPDSGQIVDSIIGFKRGFNTIKSEFRVRSFSLN